MYLLCWLHCFSLTRELFGTAFHANFLDEEEDDFELERTTTNENTRRYLAISHKVVKGHGD